MKQPIKAARKEKKDSRRRKKKAKVELSSYKSKPCQFYVKGKCQKGQLCTYNHNVEQGTNELCKYFLTGNCLKTQCLYSHDRSLYPCKYFSTLGHCSSGGDCPFTHGPVDNSVMQRFIKANSDFILQHSKPSDPHFGRLHPVLATFVRQSLKAKTDIGQSKTTQLETLVRELVVAASIRKNQLLQQQAKVQQISQSKLQRGPCRVKVELAKPRNKLVCFFLG